MFGVVLFWLVAPAAASASCPAYCYQAKWASQGAQGISVDSLDNVYVADSSNNQVEKYSPDGELLLSFGTTGAGAGQLNRPSDVGFDSADNIYVADTGNNRIQKFGPTGVFLLEWDATDLGLHLNTPFALALDSSDNVYVADHGNDRVQKFSSTGSFLDSWSSGGSGPNGIAVDPGGNIYVVNNGSSSVAKFDSTGTPITSWGTPGSADGEFANPIGLAATSTDVYVADADNGRIQRFTPGGVFVDKFGTPGSGNGELSGPSEIGTGSLGMIFVSDSLNNRIQRFAPAQTTSTVRLSGRKTIFTGKPATGSTVTATPGIGTRIVFGDSVPVTPGAGCAQTGPNGATCNRPAYSSPSLVLALDDGNDAASNATSLPASIDGGPGADQLTGGTDNDTLIGGLGTDTLAGGGGTDTADYSYSSVAVNVNLSLGGSQQVAAGDDDTISLIRNVTGSAQADTLTGTGSANAIDGAGGNDILRGGLGSDSLTGGTGTDTADYSTGAGPVTVDLSNGAPQNTLGAGTDTLSSLESLTGTDQGDTLTGSSVQNVVSGGIGDDTINVADSSADTANCGAGTDTVTYDGLDMIASDCETQSVIVPDGGGGGGGGGTPPPAAPDATAPALSGLAGTIKAGSPGSIAYKLSEAATVTFTLSRLKLGRKVKRRCVAQTKRNRKRRACTMFVKVAAYTQAGSAGANALPIPAKVGGKPLSPGPYRVTATARDSSGNVAVTVRLTFGVRR